MPFHYTTKLNVVLMLPLPYGYDRDITSIVLQMSVLQSYPCLVFAQHSISSHFSVSTWCIGLKHFAFLKVHHYNENLSLNSDNLIGTLK